MGAGATARRWRLGRAERDAAGLGSAVPRTSDHGPATGGCCSGPIRPHTGPGQPEGLRSLSAPISARGMRRSIAVFSVVAICFAAVCCADARSTSAPAAFRILVFTKTAGYRHASIPAAISAVKALGPRGGFSVTATADASVFTGANLARYAVVVFLLTTGNVLDVRQQVAFTHYIEAGGGFVGVHSAADTEHHWPWYGQLVGAYFKEHPAVQTAVIDVIDRDTPSTIHLPAHWTRTDEWYNFQTNPQGSVTVLATLDESTYSPGPDAMGRDHPIMWQHVFDGGRSWYFAGGHTSASYSEPLFRDALLGGILWAAGFDLPSFEAISTRVVDRRLAVTAKHPHCERCDLQLRVRIDGRWVITTVPASGTMTTAVTPELPSGRWRWTLTLTDEALAVHVATHRSIHIT
jgi:type 1 glutamine amidotransferase